MMLFNNLSKIIKDEKILDIDFIPKKIIGRDDEIKEIAFHLSYFFRESHVLPKLLVFGGTGTGKTTIILHVLKEFETECESRKIKTKIVAVKGSETKSKFEVLKKILRAIAPDIEIPSNSSEIYSKTVQTIAERGLNVLIFLDEVHDIKECDLNGTIYTISRLGQDISFYDSKEQKITKSIKGNVGYILVSNDSNIFSKLKDNTKSSLTRETIIFKRYEPNQITNILKDRLNDAFYKDTIDLGTLDFISALSVKECQDARYALILLFNSAKESEKRNLPKIPLELVEEISKTISQNYLKAIMRDLPNLFLDVLTIIYELHQNEEEINSKNIWEIYQNKKYLSQINFSRISQVITALEKDCIVYVTSSNKKTKLRDLSIDENLNEIIEVLKEKEKI